MRGIGLVVGLGLLAGGAAVEGAIIVDDFAATTRAMGNYEVRSFGADVYGGWDGPVAGVLGGARQVAVFPDAPVLAGVDYVGLGAYPGTPGVLSYSSTAGAAGMGVVFYGSVLGLEARPSLGLVIPDGSWATVELLGYDLPAGASLLVGVQVYGAAGNAPVAVNVVAGGAQTVQIPLDGVPADIRANVTGLALYFGASKGVDVQADSFSLTLVPEPGVAGVIAPVGMAMVRRRRR